MRLVFIGGTRFVGPMAARLALQAGHEVAVAHSGRHEELVAGLPVEHLHGSRHELLAPGGPVERGRPDMLVDTFAGGATAAKARELAACAARAGAGRIVAVSSMDVYEYLVQAGIGDGSGRVLLPNAPIPLDEDSPLRSGPYPGARDGHDNVAMEAALHDAGTVTALRPGAIYGPHDYVAREWPLVRRIKERVRRLELPDGGVQVFHRVAVERVARAIVAAAERAPEGFWACNVVDPYDWTYAGLATEIARLLDWEWQPVKVPFEAAEHAFQVSSPALGSDRRLREVLGVSEPDPRSALAELVAWYWEHGPAPDALCLDL